MNASTECPTSGRPRRSAWQRHAWRISLIYAGFASLWIFASDRTVFHFLEDYQNIVWVNVGKGLFFVFTTSLLLWSLMKRMLTGLERSQSELAEREDQIRTIYNAVGDGIIITDPETREILSANWTVGTLFGRKPEALVGLRLPDLAADGRDWCEAPATGESLAAAPESGHPPNEKQCLRSDGATFWAEVVCLETTIGGRPRLLVTIRDITRRREVEQEILESRARLRALLNHIEEAREEERARISREVHDVLGQLLTGMKMNLRWIGQRLRGENGSHTDNGVLREKLDETDSFANSILASIQEIAHDLRPDILDRLGLVPALRFEAGRFTKRFGIECQFNTLLESIRLPPEKQTHVFRIVQELLTNVARHSGADMVTINLMRRDSGCAITVSDNGAGITEQTMRDAASLGILGMMERAALLGGTLEIRPAPKKGTNATLTFQESRS